MKYQYTKLISFLLAISVSTLILSDCGDCHTTCKTNHTITCLTPRSQSFNNVIKNAGLDPYHQFATGMECFNGNFSIALEYSQTFRNDKLADCYFGPASICNANTSGSSGNCCDFGCNEDGIQIRVRGTQATTPANGTTDLVAENFFLSKNFNSVLSISPSIKNINVHLQFFAGFDEWVNGMYMRLYAPITNARWDLDVCETPTQSGTIGFAAGEIASEAVGSPALFQSFTSFARGNSITISDSITVQPLRFAKFACDTLTETKLADLRAEFGWNFLRCDDYHMGLYLEVAAPTGNDCCEGFLFSPIVGNGHYWELGAGLTGHWTLWRGHEGDKQFDFCLEADVTHMFKHSTTRTFDLKGKPLSRYMMAQQLTTTPDNLTVIVDNDFVAPNAQFNNVYAPVANFSTQAIDVSIAAQGEVTAKFVYTCTGFSWEIGYDFYGRSCEDIEFDCECNTFPASRWALRGDAQVFGFVIAGLETDAVALGATRNEANVFSLSGGGTPNVVGSENDTPNNNQINNATLAFDDDSTVLVGVPAADSGSINTSNSAIFIARSDLDVAGSQTRMISNKIFTNFNYTWLECDTWIPYVGVGASVEFGSTHDNHNGCCSTNVTNVTITNNCNNDCDDCSTCTPSQWALWIKGGISFQ